jgi:ATP-dependent Zn protease
MLKNKRHIPQDTISNNYKHPSKDKDYTRKWKIYSGESTMNSTKLNIKSKKAEISNKALIEIISWIVFFAIMLGLLIYISKKLP